MRKNFHSTKIRHKDIGTNVRSTGNDISGHYKRHSFLFTLFFSVVYFSHRRSDQIKKLIEQKLMGLPKNLRVRHFPDPVSHFWPPQRTFWIFEVLIEGIIKSKKLFSSEC